jgi:hypothetical protein
MVSRLAYTSIVDSLERLRNDLWERWMEAFDRFPALSRTPAFSQKVVYAKVPLFSLKSYTPGIFPAGGRTFQTPPEGINACFTYRLDGKGHPLQMASRHLANRTEWRGLYLYGDTEVEYIELCVNTKVVSEYSRMEFHSGIPSTFQRIRINGGGSHVENRIGKAAVESIQRDSYFYWLELEEYKIEAERLASAAALSEGARLPPTRSNLEYSYAPDGSLQRIDRVLEDGRKVTEFAVKSKSGITELSARLSEKIAVRTIDALKTAKFAAPMQVLEVSFRSVTNYLPILIPATVEDSVSDLSLTLSIDSNRWMSLVAEEFEPDMTDFAQRLSNTEKWDLGSKMVRQAARKVTERAPDFIATADSFLAFAIDWELEGHDLAAILKQCGATAATLKRLKTIGWLK